MKNKKEVKVKERADFETADKLQLPNVVFCFSEKFKIPEHQEEINLKFQFFLRQNSPLPIKAGFKKIYNPGWSITA
jgi:hypothetical protein